MTQPLKILWFTNTPCSAAEKMQLKQFGGGWLKALEQEMASRDDINLHICFYSPVEHEPFKYGNTFYYPIFRNAKSSKINRLINRIGGNNKDLKELEQLKKVSELVNPDIIHIHGTEENFGLLQDQITTPVVISIQGILTPFSHKFFSGIPEQIASGKESLSDKLKFKSARLLFKMISQKAIREQRIYQMTRNVIGRTSWDKQVTQILSPGSRYYYNNEALRKPFYEAVWEKKAFNQKLSIVTISSDSLYKGFETIVQTAELLKGYPSFSFEWKIAGLNHNSKIVQTTLAWLKKDLDSLNIKLMGVLDENALVHLLKESDIYCQVSHAENSPNSLCEAMLLGMPVVASFAGGTASMLTNEKEGLLVQDGDPFALAGALLQIRENFEQAATLAKHARNRAIQRHNKKNIVEDLINIYKSVINNKA